MRKLHLAMALAVVQAAALGCADGAGGIAAPDGPPFDLWPITLADVSWVVILDRLVEADWAEHFWGGGRRPMIAAYWERLRARPSFASEIENVRAPVTRQGIADLAAAKRADPALRAALEEN